MRKRVRPTLKLSLLSYAIAAAVSGGAAQAADVDLCSGLTSISVSTEGGRCTLDTAGAALTVTETGLIDLGVAASVADASVNNAGQISQSDSEYRSSTGYIMANASAVGLAVAGDQTGAITNSGTISANADATAYAYSSYTSGTISSSYYYYSTPGTAGAYANATGVSVGGSLAGLTNSGTISASSYAYAWGSSYTSYESNDATAVEVDGELSSLTNSGSISASAYSGDATATGISAGTLGDLTNTVDGSISAYAGSSSSYASSAHAVAIGANALTGTLTNDGEIMASANASYYADAVAIRIDSSAESTGAIVNNGGIDATAYSDYSSAYARGIQVYGDFGGDITNNLEGEISAEANASYYASAAAIAIYGDYSGDLVNNGTISADADASSTARAYGIDAGDITGSVTNAGSIDARAYVDYYGDASAYGIRTGDITTSLVNSGEVYAQADGYYNDAHASGITTDGLSGNLTNEGSGSVSAYAYADGYASATGIALEGDYFSGPGPEVFMAVEPMTGTLANSGTVSAYAQGADASAFGVVLAGSFDGTVTNSGDIYATARGKDFYDYSVYSSGSSNSASAVGLLSVGGLSGTVTNSGMISASAEGYDADATAVGIAGGLSGEFTNDQAGEISAWANGEYARATAVFIEGGSSGSPTPTFVSESGGLAGTFVNNGTIEAVAGSSSSSYAYHGTAIGIELNGVDEGGSLTNNGVVRATAYAEYGAATGISVGSVFGSLNNAGDVQAMVSGYYGNVVGISANEVYGSLSNSGNVEAYLNGGFGSVRAISVGYVDSDASVSIGGDVTAMASVYSGYVAGIMASSVYGSLSNSGDVVASLDAFGGTVRAMSVDYVDVDATVSNTGSLFAEIDASYGAAIGLQISTLAGVASNTGDIRAEADFNTSYSGGTAYGVNVSTLSGVFNNSGDISADASNGDAYSLYVSSGDGVFNNSGVLDGDVYVGDAVTVNNTGSIVLSSGDSAYVNGNYVQSGAGKLVLNITNADGYASLYVNGTADLTDSSHVHVEVAPDSDLASGDEFTDVVEATTLQLSSDQFYVTDNSIFWTFDQTVDTTSLTLTANELTTEEALAGSGLSDSQVAFVDEVMDDLNGGDYSDLALAFFNSATAGEAAELMEEAGPVLPGAAGNAARAATNGATRAISARLGGKRGGSSGDAFTSNAVWLKPFLGKAQQDTVGAIDGYDVDTGGFVIGIDGDVSDTWRVGVAVASSMSEVEAVDTGLDVDSLLLSTYGTYAISDTTSLDLDLVFVDNSYDSVRDVGFVNSTARATYDGQQVAFGLTLTGQMKMGEKVTFEPSLMARYNRVSIDSYSETGAGVYNLDVNSTQEDSMLWAAKGAIEAGLGNGFLLANVGVGYDTLDAASVTATFSGAGSTFVTSGVKPESTVLFAGVGYRYVTKRNLEIDAMYDLESRGDFSANTASLKFKLPF